MIRFRILSTGVSIVLFVMAVYGIPHTVNAEPDFSISFNVDYAFDENGNATVVKRITLINLNSETYPSAYLVDVPNDASDIAAVNEKGTLAFETLHEAGRKMVRISIPNMNVGYHEKTNITLSFKTRALSKNINGVWEIAIPPFSVDEHIVSYDTHISPPASWGEPEYVSPDSATPYLWTLDERGKESIVITYGSIAPTTSTPASQNGPAQSLVITAGLALGLVLFTVLFTLHRKLVKKTSTNTYTKTTH